MKMDELVSVIVPVYNVAPYLEEALDSVLNQSYRKLEIIVVDDGSTDESGIICDVYAEKDSRITVIHQENKGLSAARNIGIEKSTGQVIAFLDPDDVLHIDMIQSLLLEMENQHADIVICDFFVVKDQSRLDNCIPIIRGKQQTIEKKRALGGIIKGAINTAPWNKLYKREIWSTIRFPEGHVFEGTYVAFDILSAAERITIVKGKYVFHRKRAKSICNSFSLNKILDGAYARKHSYEFVTRNVPQLFSERQMKRMARARVYSLLKHYIQYCICCSSDVEGKEKIRQAIIGMEISKNRKRFGVVALIIYRAVLVIFH